jgi:hypothetical protein
LGEASGHHFGLKRHTLMDPERARRAIDHAAFALKWRARHFHAYFDEPEFCLRRHLRTGWSAVGRIPMMGIFRYVSFL